MTNRLKPTDLNPEAGAPPVAKRAPETTIVHGTAMQDPYRWLRDPDYPDVSDPAVLEYLEAENDYYNRLFEPHEQFIEKMVGELRARITEDDRSVPVKDGEWVYQSRYSRGDEYRAHYRRHVDSSDWKLVLDERSLASGHDYFKLGGMDISDDSVLAYSTDVTGDERYLLSFVALDGAESFPERIPNTIDDPIWIPETQTVLYLELSDQWRPYRVRAHTLGTPAEEDPVLYEEADEGFFLDVDLSQDRRYAILSAGDHETTEVRFLRCDAITAPPTLITPRRRGHEYSVDHAGGYFYILTNDTAVNFRLVRTPDESPGEEHWREVIPGRQDTYLHSFACFASFLLLEERYNAADQIIIHPYEGEPHRVSFPEAISVAHEGENPEFEVDTVQLRYESMVTPPTVYDYNVETRELVQRKVQEIPSGYDRSHYVTERVMVPARDGTSVPVSIVHRDDFPRDGSAPLHLYAYGAYGYGSVPGFSRDQLSLLDRGFAFAIAHVRGGDELGYSWYLSGKLMKRWNAFTDFIDAARHLIEKGYTSAGRICITGGSAGGELVGVALNEAPELFAAAVAHVPFVDVTNTMLDETLPLTPMEWPEWGNPIEDETAFVYIRSYSPYDNVGPHGYPPLLVTAGLSDPRVTYWEPAKWVARLRDVKTDENVVMLKTNMGAGHAGKSGRFSRLREVAEEIVFLLLSVGKESA